MTSIIGYRHSILILFIVAFTTLNAQTNKERIQGKWIVEKFQVEKNTPEALQAQKEIIGLCLTFEDQVMILTRKTETGDSMIKKGQYLISENSLTIGSDKADVLFLSDTQLKIIIPKQGVLYLTKL